MPTDYVLRKPATGSSAFRLTGRHVLAICVAFFAVVASVNGFMMFRAISTMPGLDARNGYDPSQRFNADQEEARLRFERGWSSRATLVPEAAGYGITVELSDPQGKPLTGLIVDVRLAHPADTRRDLAAALNEAEQGRYNAALPAARTGAWDVTITARREAGGAIVYKSQARTVLKASP